jgi:hypothetical protein
MVLRIYLQEKQSKPLQKICIWCPSEERQMPEELMEYIGFLEVIEFLWYAYEASCRELPMCEESIEIDI